MHIGIQVEEDVLAHPEAAVSAHAGQLERD